MSVPAITSAHCFSSSLISPLSFIDDNGEISEELKQCAEVIAGTDVKMLEIRKKIEAQGVTVRRD